jgi:hypothetical protein
MLCDLGIFWLVRCPERTGQLPNVGGAGSVETLSEHLLGLPVWIGYAGEPGTCYLAESLVVDEGLRWS